jgi:hypothetical protein
MTDHTNAEGFIIDFSGSSRSINGFNALFILAQADVFLYQAGQKSVISLLSCNPLMRS